MVSPELAQGLQSEGAIQVDPETREVVMKFRLPGFSRQGRGRRRPSGKQPQDIRGAPDACV